MPHAVLSQTIFRAAEGCRHFFGVFQLFLVCEAAGAHVVESANLFSLGQCKKCVEGMLTGWEQGVYISDPEAVPGCGAEEVVKVMRTTADFCTSMYA
jgi:hypothetical protein